MLTPKSRAQDVELAQWCAEQGKPLETPTDLDPLMERIGDARYVLLGEATHGTSEYYVWRMWLTQRLIQEKGFSFIGVEGDWPYCYCVNRYVKDYNECGTSAREVLSDFQRWPTWMWANWEIVALTEWLRKHNASLPPAAKVGFYGLDVYSLWESLDSVLRYLEQEDGQAADAARQAYHCFEPYYGDEHRYARATDSFIPTICRDEVTNLLTALRRQTPGGAAEQEAHFVAEQNALVVQGAEAYYRTMMQGGHDSWNLRDTHMFDTLERLMNFHAQHPEQGAENRKGEGEKRRKGETISNPESTIHSESIQHRTPNTKRRPVKAIVWEHNTHIGDARATDMAEEGMHNIGQLAREHHSPEDVFLVGCGSYQGSVIAGRSWGADWERMNLPPAREGSWEAILRQAGERNKLLLLDDAPDIARTRRGHRAVGVVYNPEQERWGNYVPTILPDRYDAFLYVDTTRALHPLPVTARFDNEPPDLFPWEE